jgi:elongator complex protein 3
MPRYTYKPRATGITPQRHKAWQEKHLPPLDKLCDEDLAHVRAYVEAISTAKRWKTGKTYDRIVRRLGRAGRPTLGKGHVRRVYLALVATGELPRDERVLRRLRLKPARTQSGIVPISVMVKPAPCPGRCIFCPTDTRMPKSYLSNEPAGQRALTLQFDPYRQTEQRLNALRNIGHPVGKVELIVLGGTWSSYEREYQAWFVKRMLDALNEQEAPSLSEAQTLNETAPHRNTGLVIETRPDYVTADEIRWLRQLGVTRVQLGLQSADDDILRLNKRGHTVEEVRRAVRQLRSAGFKIALHWMPNLLGATLASDRADFQRIWADPALRPDELKIYPTGLMRDTELYDHYLRGDYTPYAEADLRALLADCMAHVPEYCRVNRVMRDIPAPEIVEGTTTSNLRQLVEQDLRTVGTPSRDIRAREVRGRRVSLTDISYETLTYETDHSREHFLSAVTDDDKLAGFLRLSLPTTPNILPELDGCAMIRQVQVYGQSIAVGAAEEGRAQHRGIGTTLIKRAFQVTQQAGFERIAVIASVGTREYYRRFGFKLDGLYMTRPLPTASATVE